MNNWNLYLHLLELQPPKAQSLFVDCFSPTTMPVTWQSLLLALNSLLTCLSQLSWHSRHSLSLIGTWWIPPEDLPGSVPCCPLRLLFETPLGLCWVPSQLQAPGPRSPPQTRGLPPSLTLHPSVLPLEQLLPSKADPGYINEACPLPFLVGDWSRLPETPHATPLLFPASLLEASRSQREVTEKWCCMWVTCCYSRPLPAPQIKTNWPSSQLGLNKFTGAHKNLHLAPT